MNIHEFKNGEKILLLSGKSLIIKRVIGRGGSGIVYLVDYNGEDKALKFYNNGSEKKQQQIFQFCKIGLPCESFKCPIDVTQMIDGSFGYVMNLVPREYVELDDMQKNPAKYSFKLRVDVCLQIVTAMRLLHKRGLCYQDFGMHCISFHPDTGRVLLWSDSISVEGEKNEYGHNRRFSSPELIVNPENNTVYSFSNLHSMAVVIFILLFIAHPLEGKRWLTPWVNTEKLYGTDPLFIFDPEDGSNRPHEIIHKNAITIWNCMPKYMKETFTKAFSQEALHEPSKRIRTLEWQKILTRFRSDIVKCECGNEIFLIDSATTKCDECGKPFEISYQIKLPEYSIAALRNTRIYRCMLGVCNPEKELDPVAVILEGKNNSKMLGLRNKTDHALEYITPDGKEGTLEPKKVVQVIDGIRIKAYDDEMRIINAPAVVSDPLLRSADDQKPDGGIVPLYPANNQENGDPAAQNDDKEVSEGVKKCRLLKKIRKEVADANQIPYEITSCDEPNGCIGTCPKCEEEARCLSREIEKKIADGEIIKLNSAYFAEIPDFDIKPDSWPLMGDIAIPEEIYPDEQPPCSGEWDPEEWS